MTRIAVIDYGMGNLRSVAKAIEFVAPDATVTITGNPVEVAQADRVVFPGQSAMPDCMKFMRESGLDVAVTKAAKEKPFIGMCLGMQMLFDSSEESHDSADTPALGILPGRVTRFRLEGKVAPDGTALKVPHMGWNQVWQYSEKKKHPLWQGISDGSRFYFANSYYLTLETTDASGLTAATANYPTPFTVAVAQDNIFTVQFHPEKSDAAGLQLLRNFVNWRI